MTTHITFSIARKELKEIAKSNPEFSQHICKYVIGDKPYCIIAHWLHNKHGMSVETLKNHEGLRVDLVIFGTLGTITASTKAIEFLTAVQSNADMGCGWQQAVDEALDWIEI